MTIDRTDFELWLGTLETGTVFELRYPSLHSSSVCVMHGGDLARHSPGEDVGQSQVFGQFQQRPPVLMDAHSPRDLRP